MYKLFYISILRFNIRVQLWRERKYILLRIGTEQKSPKIFHLKLKREKKNHTHTTGSTMALFMKQKRSQNGEAVCEKISIPLLLP